MYNMYKASVSPGFVKQIMPYLTQWQGRERRLIYYQKGKDWQDGANQREGIYDRGTDQ
jgi:hypothetical protein